VSGFPGETFAGEHGRRTAVCGRSTLARSTGSGRDRHQNEPDRTGGAPEPGQERTSPRARIASAMSVLVPVALSGVFLVVFVPQLWWIFTTYFWVAFPALGSLRQGLVGAIEERPRRVPARDAERELLAALKRYGKLTSALAAAETSLSVAEAGRRLGELANDGHLEVRAQGGAIFYALWESEPGERQSLTAGEDRH